MCTLPVSLPLTPNQITPSPISSTITWWVTFQHAEEGAGQGPLGPERTQRRFPFQRRSNAVAAVDPGRLAEAQPPLSPPDRATEEKRLWPEAAPQPPYRSVLSGRHLRVCKATEEKKGGPGQNWPITENEPQSSFNNMNTSRVSLQLATNYWCFCADRFPEQQFARTSFVRNRSNLLILPCYICVAVVKRGREEKKKES